MARSHNRAGRGPSQRQLRVGELIRRTLSELLLRGEVHDPELTSMSVTVSEVRITPDLQLATVFVLPLGGEGGEGLIAALARNRGQLRARIGRAAGLKHAPDLRFRLDESFDRAEATRALFEREEVRRDLERGHDGEAGVADSAAEAGAGSASKGEASKGEDGGET